MRLLTGRGAELDIFELRFDGSAQQVNATLVGALNLKLLAATTCAQQMVHAALTTPYGQFEPELEAQFQQVVAPLVATSGALFMYECALVTNATRAAFEAGAAASAARAVDPAVAALLAFGINDAFDANSTTLQHANESQAYFLPLMHITPLSPTLTVFLMYDAVAPSNLFERRVAFEMAATTGMPAWSDILPNTAVNSAGMVVPSNLLVVPALAPGSSGGAGTIGTCALAFDWTSVLRLVLPSFVTSVTAVLTSFSDRQATFALQDGVVSVVGLGDMHDARYDNYKRTASADVDGTTWGIALYPTEALLNSYLTNGPVRNAVIIAVVVSLCAALFAYYELSVRRRANTMNLLLRRNLAELGRMKAEEAEAQRRLMEAGIKQQDQFVSVSARRLLAPQPSSVLPARARLTCAGRACTADGVTRDPHATERREWRDRDAAGHGAADERAARAAGAAGCGRKPCGAHRGGQCAPCTQAAGYLSVRSRACSLMHAPACALQSCCTAR